MHFLCFYSNCDDNKLCDALGCADCEFVNLVFGYKKKSLHIYSDL